MSIEQPQSSAHRGDSSHGQPGSLHRLCHLRLSGFDVRLLWVEPFANKPVPRCHLNYLREVQSVAIGALRDLLAATEAIRDNQTIWRSFPNCRQELQFAN